MYVLQRYLGDDAWQDITMPSFDGDLDEMPVETAVTSVANYMASSGVTGRFRIVQVGMTAGSFTLAEKRVVEVQRGDNI